MLIVFLNVKAVGCVVLGLLHVVHERDKRWTVVVMLMKHQVP